MFEIKPMTSQIKTSPRSTLKIESLNGIPVNHQSRRHQRFMPIGRLLATSHEISNYSILNITEDEIHLFECVYRSNELNINFHSKRQKKGKSDGLAFGLVNRFADNSKERKTRTCLTLIYFIGTNNRLLFIPADNKSNFTIQCSSKNLTT